MIKAGVSAREVAQKFKLSYSGAKKICSKLKLTGDCGRTPGSGRKRKTTERSDRFIAKSSKSGTPTKKENTNELKNQTGVEVSTKTIQRRLREKGITWRKKSKKPFVSKKNRIARLKFAREHAGWSIEQWKRVVWSDESPFGCKNQSQQHVWRTKQETGARRAMQGTVKHLKSVNVWGCLTWHAVGDLHRVKGILTGTEHRKILIHHMVPLANRLNPEGFIFQQDNDPKHTNNVVKKYLQNKKIEVMNWPAQSPDLNPIENLLGQLNRLAQDRNPQNEDKLFEILKHAWHSMSDKYLHNLVESMPSRCKAVTPSKGWPTKY